MEREKITDKNIADIMAAIDKYNAEVGACADDKLNSSDGPGVLMTFNYAQDVEYFRFGGLIPIVTAIAHVMDKDEQMLGCVESGADFVRQRKYNNGEPETQTPINRCAAAAHHFRMAMKDVTEGKNGAAMLMSHRPEGGLCTAAIGTSPDVITTIVQACLESDDVYRLLKLSLDYVDENRGKFKKVEK